MPELREEMYCSQQICIPPTFPYVLRQFAKAAIRTQPPDLLRWSSSYFRCLALDLPPPVKPRLEYPIPRDHHGITPGWLKALLYQLKGNLTVGFRTLWDRWIGACLRHETLIRMLCLGGFTDPMHVPWFRFVGLCAAHLTDNLTQTMILVCEILTEEPEGGSAMIPVEVFNDVYQFLAAIDASKPQILYNIYFTDNFLGLLEDEAKSEEKEAEEEEEAMSEMIMEEEEAPPEEEEAPKELSDEGTVSCPDIAADKEEKPLEEEEEAIVIAIQDPNIEQDVTFADEPSIESFQMETKVERLGEEEHEEEGGGEEPQAPVEKTEVDVQEEEDETVCKTKLPEEEWESKVTLGGSDEVIGEPPAEEKEEIAYLDLGLLNVYDVEEEEGGDERGEVLEEEQEEEKKEDLLFQKPRHLSDIEIEQFLVSDKDKPEEIYVEAIEGIGGIVPENVVKDVIDYMKRIASEQHGVVMPRNIRHYNCPPLEVLYT